MTDPGPVAAQASLDAARSVLSRMMSAAAAAGERTPPITMARRAADAWSAVEHVLHNVTGRPELGGQPLLAEARRQERLSLDDAHAIMALSDWTERTRAPGSAAQMLTLAPTEAERDVAANVLHVLERAVSAYAGNAPFAAFVPPPFTPVPESPNRFAPPPAASVTAATFPASPPPITTGAPDAASRNVVSRAADTDAGAHAPPALADARTPRSSGLVVGAIVAVLAVACVAGWYALRGTSSASATDQGVAAYTRGSIETARLALTDAVKSHPNDARALTYLGRITREQGDAATARTYLERAIRIEPDNALALRELGSALLADHQPELARRFYVRALTVNGSDKLAQGFLACALSQLNRTDEAARWLERAGPGDWSRCVSPNTSSSPGH